MNEFVLEKLVKLFENWRLGCGRLEMRRKSRCPGGRGFRSNIQLAAAVARKIQSKRLSHSVVAPLLRTFPGMTHQK